MPRKDPTQFSLSSEIITRENGAFWAGVGLIGCGVADAAMNPFDFATATELIGSGITLIGISVGLSPDQD